MRAALYSPFPDPWRQSMRVYAEQLHGALAGISSEDHFARVSLPEARLTPPARYWDQYVRYPRLARRTIADVHHILDHGFAHLAAAMPKRRIVVTFHDAIPLRTGLASYGTRRALETGMRTADARGARFIAVSEVSKTDAMELFGISPASITVVPNGVDARFRPAVDREGLRAELRLSRPCVLIVGHTQPYMNVEGAIRAAACAARATDLDVVKIGAPLTIEQGTLARSEGVAEAIRELGIISDDDLARWYAAADALIYLPLLSGFGLPVLEAMAAGLPVVASNTGGVADLARDAAATVDPRDASAAGTALTRMLTDETARDAAITRGFERARAYSWRATATATIEVYRSVAGAA